MAGHRLPQIQFPTCVININPCEITLSVVVKHHAFGNFPAFGPRLRRKIDVEGISFWVIILNLVSLVREIQYLIYYMHLKPLSIFLKSKNTKI